MCAIAGGDGAGEGKQEETEPRQSREPAGTRGQSEREQRREYADRGIRVNALCPGLIDTPMFREWIGRRAEVLPVPEAYQATAGTPEPVGHAAVWLCSSQAAGINGLAIPVEGGRRAPAGA